MSNGGFMDDVGESWIGQRFPKKKPIPEFGSEMGSGVRMKAIYAPSAHSSVRLRHQIRPALLPRFDMDRSIAACRVQRQATPAAAPCPACARVAVAIQ